MNPTPTPEERQEIEKIIRGILAEKAYEDFGWQDNCILTAHRYASQVTAQLKQKLEAAEKERKRADTFREEASARLRRANDEKAECLALCEAQTAKLTTTTPAVDGGNCIWVQADDRDCYFPPHPGADYYLTEGLGLHPFCQWCGKPIKVQTPQEKQEGREG